MFIRNGKRFNVDSPCVMAVEVDIGEGKKETQSIQFPAGFFRDPESREQYGITEIPDPVRQPDETHFNQEIDVPPYLVSTPKPQEMIDESDNRKVVARIEEIERDQLRAIREAVLTGDKTRLQKIDDDIVKERAKLKKKEVKSQ